MRVWFELHHAGYTTMTSIWHGRFVRTYSSPHTWRHLLPAGGPSLASHTLRASLPAALARGGAPGLAARQMGRCLRMVIRRMKTSAHECPQLGETRSGGTYTLALVATHACPPLLSISDLLQNCLPAQAVRTALPLECSLAHTRTPLVLCWPASLGTLSHSSCLDK